MAHFVETLKLRFFTFIKIPLIWFVRPVIVDLRDESVLVKIPLVHRTKNHVRSMYFGALSIGADLCIGLIAMHHIKLSGKRIVLVFKDFQANFLKRATSDVFFRCTEGKKIKALVDKVIQSGERQNEAIYGEAFIKENGNEVVVAEFTLTLSLK